MWGKSTICKTANKLRKQGYTLSQAFKMAWRLAKGTASVKVAGVSKGSRQTAIQHLISYSPEDVRITLIRENRNTFDSNAIAVMVSVNGSQLYKMGYMYTPQRKPQLHGKITALCRSNNRTSPHLDRTQK